MLLFYSKTPSGSARVSGPVGKKKSSGPDVPSHWDMDAHSNDPYFQLVQVHLIQFNCLIDMSEMNDLFTFLALYIG